MLTLVVPYVFLMVGLVVSIVQATKLEMSAASCREFFKYFMIVYVTPLMIFDSLLLLTPFVSQSFSESLHWKNEGFAVYVGTLQLMLGLTIIFSFYQTDVRSLFTLAAGVILAFVLVIYVRIKVIHDKKNTKVAYQLGRVLLEIVTALILTGSGLVSYRIQD